MKWKFLLVAAIALSGPLAPFALAQEDEDASDEEIAEAPAVSKLSLEEQLKLRAAQQKAAEDPAVQTALAKRNAAIEEFRQAVHDSMVKANPALEAILAKIAVGNSPGF